MKLIYYKEAANEIDYKHMISKDMMMKMRAREIYHTEIPRIGGGVPCGFESKY